MKQQKIKIVFFHTTVPVPGIPSLQMMAGGEKTPGVSLEMNDFGILISKGSIRAFTPMVNVKSVIFESEPAK